MKNRAQSMLARLQPLACGLGFGLVGLISVAGKLIVPLVVGTDAVHVTLLYLMAVLFLAVQFGLWPALLTASISVAALDYLFLPPLYSFSIRSPDDALLLAFFAVVAVTASSLAARSRAQMRLVRQYAETNTELYRFAGRLAATVTLDAAIAAVENQVESMLGRHARVRLGGATVPAQTGLSVPLRTAGEMIGTMELAPAGGPAMSSGDKRLLDTLAELTAVAIGRLLLADELSRLGIEREADRLRSALLSSIAHDLTAPIASIASVLAGLDSGYQTFDDTARHDLIAEARHESEYLHRFAASLVAMTRLEAGALELERDLVDVGELVNRALGRARHILAPRRVEIAVPSDLPTVRVDAVLIEQAIFNLLENAAKYTPPDATVTISAEAAKGNIVLQIADAGPGFPAEDSDRIFTKFYRSPATSGPSPGIGLGLAICRGFIEAHGGAITASSRSDRPGAVFTITLPTERHSVT